ncbi:MAG: ABC transporter permease [Deltaproteobacteria bacterium]|nr:ABC transporter permease [Deltaproteobacteria bacterium]
MSPKVYLRALLRESRGSRGRLLFFIACLAVGVAAVVAVSALAASLEAAIRSEARQLLAADLKVSGRQPLPTELDAFLQSKEGVERTDLKELVTIVAAQATEEEVTSGTAAPSQLVELKVVEEAYPFFGEIEVHPAATLSSLLHRGVVVAPDLLTRLGLAVGDPLRIGSANFQISGTVLSEPDRISFNLTMGPRVFLSAQAFDQTGLETFGSRIGYRALLKLPEGTTQKLLKSFAEDLEASLPNAAYYNVETYTEAQPAMRQGLRQVERFLALVALVALLTGGIGVAQTVRAWLAGRLQAIAILKCLGMRPREVLTLYLGQTTLLGAAGSLAGGALGLMVPQVAPILLGDLIPASAVSSWQPLALFQGVALGIGIAIIFSVPPLLALLRVPPVRVLRHQAESLPANRRANWAAAALLLLGIALASLVQTRSPWLAAQFTGGVIVVTAVLMAVAAGTIRLVGRLPRDLGRPWLRYGLANLGRPGSATTGAIVALGLGVMVVLAMSLVETHLSHQLRADLPEDSPTGFLVDIQQDQWEGVQNLLQQQEAKAVDSVPVVMARLSSIDGTSIQKLAEENPEDRDRRWALTREQRLTYLDELGDDNEVVEGALWSDPTLAEVSVETEFAKELGIGIGSRLGFDIQGVPLELAVTSLRTVRWETFRINFFLVVEPGVLDTAPQFRVAAARLPRDREQSFQDLLSAQYPNITLLRIREILEKIAGVLGRLGVGVRFLGGFTVLAGLAILAGAVSAGASRRGREVALLKTLGLTRIGVLAAFTVEYACLGLAAGIIGAAAGGVLAWAVVTQGMEIDWVFLPKPFFFTILGSAALTALAGNAASLRALAQRPITVLRRQDS